MYYTKQYIFNYFLSNLSTTDEHSMSAISLWDCEKVLWCATVFHNCYSLIVRIEARILEMSKFCTKLILKRQQFFSKKLRHLWLVLRQLRLINIAAIVVGVATIVVFFDNCGWCCENCGWLRQLWPSRQLWSHQPLLLITWEGKILCVSKYVYPVWFSALMIKIIRG